MKKRSKAEVRPLRARVSCPHCRRSSLHHQPVDVPRDHPADSTQRARCPHCGGDLPQFAISA